MAAVFTLLLFDEQQVCWWSSLTPQTPPHLQALNQPQKLMGKVIFNGLAVSQQGWGNRFVPRLVVKTSRGTLGFQDQSKRSEPESHCCSRPLTSDPAESCCVVLK